MPVDVAILRGTTAYAAGNISMEREVLRADNLTQAMAAKNSGGIVIVQVEKLVEKNAINSRTVEIPGVMVDALGPARPESHVQTYAANCSLYLDGHERMPKTDGAPTPWMRAKLSLGARQRTCPVTAERSIWGPACPRACRPRLRHPLWPDRDAVR